MVGFCCVPRTVKRPRNRPWRASWTQTGLTGRDAVQGSFRGDLGPDPVGGTLRNDLLRFGQWLATTSNASLLRLSGNEQVSKVGRSRERASGAILRARKIENH